LAGLYFLQLDDTKGPPNELLKKSLEDVSGSIVTDANWIEQILKKEQFKFDPKKKLGKGAYSVVYKGEIHGIVVAIKLLKVLMQVDSFVKECTLLSRI